MSVAETEIRKVEQGDSQDWLAAKTDGPIVGVDKEAEIIHGFIVAQEGPFKSEGRGEFDVKALKTIVKFMKDSPNGLKSRFTHPDMSNDGLGKFLGRAKNPRLDKISVRDSEGTKKDDEITVVRADLHIDPSSHSTPSGDLGGYIMRLVANDPDALSSSLVLRVEQEYRTDKKGHPEVDDDGNELPPLWRPLALHATDIVDTGDAVDGLLSANLDAEGLPDGVVRKASELMDRQFAGKPREFVESRCVGWLTRYLNRRYGEPTGSSEEDGTTEESATILKGELTADVVASTDSPPDDDQPAEAVAKYHTASDPDIREREITIGEIGDAVDE